MRTKEENIALAKNMIEALGLRVEDLLENKVNPSQDASKFLDIQKINSVPCMYLFYNKETTKQEWLCLEIPNEPKMRWEEGREWCQSKGGDYGSISTLKFISERISEINQVLENKGYPLVEYGCHWSTEDNNFSSWRLYMNNGDIYSNLKSNYNGVRAVVVS